MRSGTLRHRVVIQKPTETTDGKGGYTTAWSTAATVWAQVQPIGSRDRWVAEQISPEISHLITVRYNSNINHKCRVYWSSRYFNIVSIRDPEERHEMMVLMTKEDRT